MNQPKPSILRRFVLWLRRAWRAILPGHRAWTGAALGLLVVALLFVVSAVRASFGALDPSGVAVGMLMFLLIGALAALLAWLLRRVLVALPGGYVAAAAAAVALLLVALLPATVLDPTLRYPRIILGTLIVASLLGAGVWVLLRGSWKGATSPQRVMIGLGLVLGLVGAGLGSAWLLADGRVGEPPVNAAAMAHADIAPLTLPDPSQPGEYPVRTLSYGSGQDLHRPEYGAEAELITQPVDGSALVRGWSGLRSSYWGFGPKAMPLNGRVWYPEGDGPFPLVLMVHGNAVAEQYSDPGYAYLGELLASRGMITVSVDENFLNISPSADLALLLPLIDENDARGWLLLEHLRAWQAWNETPTSPFYQQVDMARIALIGHSRGGEAVAAAATFNRLPYYPDDASLAFDYGFGIRAVAAIAPVDGLYRPGGQPLPLENVSYFVLHGAQDTQTPFAGRRMYNRLRFSDGEFHFKAALYFHGANHGQFNTVWGRKDALEPGARLLNLRALMPAEEQRQAAKVYLSAFLDAALRGETGYLPLFRDARCAPGWLPDSIYLTQYNDSATQMVSTFEDDLDLTTGDLPGSSQQGQNLTVWREQRIVTKDASRLDTRAAYLGWDSHAIPDPALYVIRLPEQGLFLNEESVLVLALADAGESSNPRGINQAPAQSPAGVAHAPIDLTIAVADRSGQVARLPLSHRAYVQPRIPSRAWKADWLSGWPASEIVLSSFEFPLADFAQANPALDPTALTEVRLLFDRTPAGVVVLDDLGFR